MKSLCMIKSASACRLERETTVNCMILWRACMPDIHKSKRRRSGTIWGVTSSRDERLLWC
jgi:hypothetical protein